MKLFAARHPNHPDMTPTGVTPTAARRPDRRRVAIGGAIGAVVLVLLGAMVVSGGSGESTTTAGNATGAKSELSTGDASTQSTIAGAGTAGSDGAAFGVQGASTTTTLAGTGTGRGSGTGSTATPATRGNVPVVGDGASLSLAMVRPGEAVTFRAAGFRPASTVRVELHSNPILLATLTASGDGTASGTLTIPTSAPLGDHHVVASGTDSQGAPLTRSVPLVVGGDTTPPVLREFSFTPGSVDTSTGTQTITVRARMTDAGVGVAGEGFTHGATEVRFLSPSGAQMADTSLYKLVSGDASDGIYESTMTVSAGSEQGTWRLQFMWLIDKVGNRATLDAAAMTAAGFPTTFEVVKTG
jgi:hypothetical protein